MKIEGLEKLKEKLRERQRAALKDSGLSALAGYSAKYARYLHEMPESSVKTLGEQVERPSEIGWYWGPADRGPLFLINPARELAPELGQMVRESLQARQTMRQALAQAGVRLRQESRNRVPREYGNLFRSAFVEIESAGGTEVIP